MLIWFLSHRRKQALRQQPFAFTTKINQRTVYVVSFALPITANKENTNINIYARDKAETKPGVVPAFFIKEKPFRTDSVALSESFLQAKMPEFHLLSTITGKIIAGIF